jgi:hypothetical protein
MTIVKALLRAEALFADLLPKDHRIWLTTLLL